MQKLVVLTGPTAVGKTSLSIKLAKAVNGEIISADCIQVYKKLDIGSAKITPEEMDGVKHHLIDVLEPEEDCDVVTFVTMAKAAIKDITDRGKVPIICGGTGFYIQALLYDIDFSEESEEDHALREKLYAELEEIGPEKFHEKLKEFDPVSYEEIPWQNKKRVVRAVEFYMLHNQPISEHNKQQRQKESQYNFAYFVINCDRNILYDRINQRVDIMMDLGLEKEVKDLLSSGIKTDCNSMKAIGYAEIIRHLSGEISLDEAVELIKQNSRHYAKRQLTWFRREKEVIWLEKNGNELETVLNILKEKGII